MPDRAGPGRAVGPGQQASAAAVSFAYVAAWSSDRPGSAWRRVLMASTESAGPVYPEESSRWRTHRQRSFRVRSRGGPLGQGEGALQSGALGLPGRLQRAPQVRDDVGGVADDEDGEGLGLPEHAHGGTVTRAWPARTRVEQDLSPPVGQHPSAQGPDRTSPAAALRPAHLPGAHPGPRPSVHAPRSTHPGPLTPVRAPPSQAPGPATEPPPSDVGPRSEARPHPGCVRSAYDTRPRRLLRPYRLDR